MHKATKTSWTRSRAPVLASRCEMWVLTVGMLTHSLSQISRFVRPMATSRRRGYYVPYVPGWDTHGLPIELKVQIGRAHV